MADTFASIAVQLGLTTDEFASGLAGAEKLLDQLGSRFTAAGIALSAAITAPLVGLGVESFNAATKMDSLMRGLTAVAGSAGAAAQQFEQLRAVAQLPGLNLESAVRGAT